MKTSYQIRVDQQGRAWVQGDVRHNRIDNECCPDFSCCTPALFEPDKRKRAETFNRWAAQYGFELIKVTQ